MIHREKDGGRDRDRTGDPLLAKQVLSQLSYTPIVAESIIYDDNVAVRLLNGCLIARFVVRGSFRLMRVSIFFMARAVSSGTSLI